MKESELLSNKSKLKIENFYDPRKVEEFYIEFQKNHQVIQKDVKPVMVQGELIVYVMVIEYIE